MFPENASSPRVSFRSSTLLLLCCFVAIHTCLLRRSVTDESFISLSPLRTDYPTPIKMQQKISNKTQFIHKPHAINNIQIEVFKQ